MSESESVSSINPRVLTVEQKPFPPPPSETNNETDGKRNGAISEKNEEEPHWWYDNNQPLTEVFHCLSSGD